MSTPAPNRHRRMLHGTLGAILGLVGLGIAWRIQSRTSAPTPGDEPPAASLDSSSRRDEPKRDTAPLVVEAVAADGGAAVAGMEIGDRIVACDGTASISPFAFQGITDNRVGSATLRLEVRRGSESITIDVPRTGHGIETRLDLSPRVLALYEAHRQAVRAGNADAAAHVAQEAAEAADGLEDRSTAAWLYTRLARQLETQSQWPAVSRAYQAALDRLPPGVDDAARSRVLLALSRYRQHEGEIDIARRHLEEAAAIDAAAGRPIWQANDLHALGSLDWSQGNLAAARQGFGDAAALRERWLPDSVQLAESLNGLGAVAYQEGQLDLAEEHYRRSLEVSERAMPDSLAVADGLNNLGVVAIARGDLDAAERHITRSLGIRERLTPDSDQVSAALTNLGIVEYRRGDLQGAQDYYLRSLEIHERSSTDTLYVARDLINLGVIAYERGDFDAAQDSYSRASTILERLAPASADLIACVFNLGLIAVDRGDWELARNNLQKALEYRERTAPDSLVVAESHNALGNLAFARSELAAAEAYYLRALEIQERIAPESLMVATCMHNLGGVATQLGELDLAQERYSRSMAIRERLAPGSLDLVSSLHGLGDVALRQGRPRESVPLLRRALDLLEAQRNNIHTLQTRALLLARYSEPYVTLQRAYLALGDPESAFDTAERARARSLLDGLGEASSDIREGVEPHLLLEERKLRERLSAVGTDRQTLLNSGASPSQLAEVERRLDEIVVEFAEIQGQIRRASPRYAELTQPNPRTLAEIRREVLDAETALIEFALGNDQSLLWLVTSESIQCHPLPSRADVDRAARRVHELVTARNQPAHVGSEDVRRLTIEQADAEFQVAAAALGEMLLGPIANHLGTKRLLIVADGALQYVPFSALPVPRGDRPNDARTGTDVEQGDIRPPLVVDHELITLPSASVLAVLRREIEGRNPPPKHVAVIADPVLAPDDARVIELKERRPSGDSLPPSTPVDDNDRHRGVTRIEPAAKLRLPFTRLEAESILELADSGSVAAMDFDANKNTVLAPDLNQYRIVHLATHGVLDSQYPDLSGIVLSLIDEHGAPRDGFLRLHEIYNLRLNADLVVLSACQTALGREVRGEGLVGLTRGFMYAGAARVIASLWNVQDKSTAELMKTFYEVMIRDHRPPAAALRAAQISMWKRGLAPYHWAAFAIQGEFR